MLCGAGVLLLALERAKFGQCRFDCLKSVEAYCILDSYIFKEHYRNPVKKSKSKLFILSCVTDLLSCNRAV